MKSGSTNVRVSSPSPASLANPAAEAADNAATINHSTSSSGFLIRTLSSINPTILSHKAGLPLQNARASLVTFLISGPGGKAYPGVTAANNQQKHSPAINADRSTTPLDVPKQSLPSNLFEV
jgi:hypothetical protein